MLQPISSAFQQLEANVAQGASKPGEFASGSAALAAADTFDLSGTGATLVEQSRLPTPKLLDLSNHLEHEKPDLSVQSDLHLNLSLFG